uniref:ATP synthase complex subunit 8 n=1 Tax=Liophloeus tessulatus TaxID=202024 RepID=J9PJK9_9CUCU|nr:ATP synthase F0 subunit 8 [Liophloeus tessulatus]
MPQMSPINWLSLFTLFIIILIIFIIMNYFSFLYKPKNLTKTKSKILINWKW